MSSFLTGPVVVAAQTLHSSSADKYHMLGEIIFANDGRAFRYCKAGTTALVAGKLQQSSAEDTGLQNLTAVAAAVDDLSVASTTTVTVTANEYAEGFALVTVTPGVGRQYKVKGHIAYTSAAPTFNLFEGVVVALTTTSRLDLVRNPYSAVVVNPITLTSAPIGVAVHPITASQFGWLQVLGVANILADGANAVGANVVASNGVAGAVEDAAAPGLQPLVGTCLTGAADTEYGAVRLAGIL
ncbi:hypothetical protein HY967_01530 [Candidatus Jorgensenbacteria bacterium]|nr:hypothetical protein [Candidatus Jorgensenbacteria bacterium]